MVWGEVSVNVDSRTLESTPPQILMLVGVDNKQVLKSILAACLHV